MSSDRPSVREAMKIIRQERAASQPQNTIAEKAVEKTNATLARVRHAMRIDYFVDRSIVKEWEALLGKAKQ